MTESKANVAKDIVCKSIPSGPEGTKSCSQGLQSLVRKSGIHHKSRRDDVQLAGLRFSLSAAAQRPADALPAGRLLNGVFRCGIVFSGSLPLGRG